MTSRASHVDAHLLLLFSALVACRSPEPPATAIGDTAPPAAQDARAPEGHAPGECVVTRVLDDGSVELRVGDERVVARIAHVDILPEARKNVVEVLARSRRSPRCNVHAVDGGGNQVEMEVFAWQDKSGDVWEEVATVLVDMGLASVSAGLFPERDDLLRRQRAAAAEHRGPWK